MNYKKAVAYRISDELTKRNWSYYRLSINSGMAISSMQNICEGKYGFKFSTLFYICCGLGISLKEFFDSPYFDKNLTD